MFTATQFRATALSLVGLPYILGAEATWPTKPKALDCSELVEWLFAGNTTPIGDLAASQWDKCITVKPGTERVGDLVALANNPARWNRIGHIAVLTARLANGDWEIVEARGRAYGVVRTTLSYWRTRGAYAGVRRYPRFALLAEPLTKTTTQLDVDGKFGPQTIRRLQSVTGAKVDGEFGPDSKRKLQTWLGVKVDGIIGPRTIRALQARVGARQDGVWGPATTRALQTYLNRLPAAL